jgi:hypothetical protein
MFFEKHEKMYEKIRQELGWSHYQMAWLGGMKGLLYGLLIGYFLF